MVAFLEPVARVVELAGQLEQSGMATVPLPPGENLPTPHAVHGDPP